MDWKEHVKYILIILDYTESNEENGIASKKHIAPILEEELATQLLAKKAIKA